MTDDGAIQSPQDRNAMAKPPGLLARTARLFAKAHSALAYIIGLPTITLLGGAIVGYYQYVHAYQEKIGLRAENDVKMATATFTDVSTKFGEAQTLQRMLFADYASTLDEHASDSDKALAAKHAQAIFPTYEAAWVALLETGDLMARNAEIYIDWATDFNRRPEDPHYPNSDPLSRSLLEKYDFDCSDNFPSFVPPEHPPEKKASTCWTDPNQFFDPYASSYVRLCPRNQSETGPKHSVTIHWYSAKHQLLTMNYCFRNLHERLDKVRAWASQVDQGLSNKPTFQTERVLIQHQIRRQAERLDAFMGLSLFQIEAIRLKYQPISFACNLPVINWWSDSCTPLRTTPYLGYTPVAKKPAQPSNGPEP